MATTFPKTKSNETSVYIPQGILMFSKQIHSTQNSTFLTIIKRETSDLNDPRNEGSHPIQLRYGTSLLSPFSSSGCCMRSLNRRLHSDWLREPEMLKFYHAPNDTLANVATAVTTARGRGMEARVSLFNGPSSSAQTTKRRNTFLEGAYTCYINSCHCVL
jgi:hypothetical protein